MKTMFLSVRNVAEMLGVARSTIWRWSADGTLPKPITIGGSARWKMTDIEAVIANAEAVRDAG